MIKRVGFIGVAMTGGDTGHKIKLMNNFAAIGQMAQAKINGVPLPPPA
jgi:hypothetical protein